MELLQKEKGVTFYPTAIVQPVSAPKGMHCGNALNKNEEKAEMIMFMLLLGSS